MLLPVASLVTNEKTNVQKTFFTTATISCQLFKKCTRFPLLFVYDEPSKPGIIVFYVYLLEGHLCIPYFFHLSVRLMIKFILNNEEISTMEDPGMPLLDFIRGGFHLTGTKIGCREGDCGACTVLEGRLHDKHIQYQSIVSCLTPLGNVSGKHIVTIEGVSSGGLVPAQKVMIDHGATQCGFCTPGFVLAFTAYAMSHQPVDPARALDAVSGNICRCTGYASIERAANDLCRILEEKDPGDPVGWLTGRGFLPGWFLTIPDRLSAMQTHKPKSGDIKNVYGGGTDMLVRQSDNHAGTGAVFLLDNKDLKRIREENGCCLVGASVTVTDMMGSQLMRSHVPRIEHFFRLISSESIRNMATIGGNLANASPAADLAVFFLALDANVHLHDWKTREERIVPLKKFFTDYRQPAINPGEIIHHLSFPIPERLQLVNFEKVSKRTTLDIASVNSAISITLHNGLFRNVHVAVGGVAPVPLYLEKTSAFLCGREATAETMIAGSKIMDVEISPISDVRGSKYYKRLLARQLFFAHFLELFPGKINPSALTGKC